MKPRFSRRLAMLCCIALIGSIAGCATFHMPFGKKIPRATAENPATQIICLWQPGEGYDPDGYPCKGFTGQLLFLSHRSSTPLQIEGDVRIYLFDDLGTVEEQAKPLRQFDFDNGSWAVHLAETSLGPTYSVFVPYTRRGVNDAQCSLRVRLKPKFGPVVFSDFSNLPLGGQRKIQKGEDAKPISTEEVEHTTAEALNNTLRRTTTISLDPNEQKSQEPVVAEDKSKSNPIQLVSHEESAEPTKSSPESDRIQRLEAMLQQLMEQKQNLPKKSVVPTTQGLEPAALDQDAESKMEELIPGRRFRIRRNSDESTPPMMKIQQRLHPLDDDSPPVTRKTDNHVMEQDPFDEPLIESNEETDDELLNSKVRPRIRRSTN